MVCQAFLELKDYWLQNQRKEQGFGQLTAYQGNKGSKYASLDFQDISFNSSSWNYHFLTDGTMPWYRPLREHSCYTQQAMTLAIWTKHCGDKEEEQSHYPCGSQGQLHREHEREIRFQWEKCGEPGPAREGKQHGYEGPHLGTVGDILGFSDSEHSLIAHQLTPMFSCYSVSESVASPFFLPHVNATCELRLSSTLFWNKTKTKPPTPVLFFHQFFLFTAHNCPKSIVLTSVTSLLENVKIPLHSSRLGYFIY